MTAPKDIHEGMLELLTEDEQLLLELARALGLPWAGRVTLHPEANSYPLPRALPPNRARLVRSRKRVHVRRPPRRGKLRRHAPYRLLPDRVFSIRDANGQLVGLLILENQLDRDPRKPWRMSGYRASVQIHFEHPAEVLGISPSAATRAWMRGFGALVKDPPLVLDLAPIVRVCNPEAEWLLDPDATGPEATEERLQVEIERARERPRAALFHAVHHARDPRAWQIVLAALIAARDLGPEPWRCYTSMILSHASEAMNDRVLPELYERFHERELSEWEKEGAGYQMGLRAGRAAGHEEGREEGREEGLEQGVQQGHRSALLDILEVRGLTLDPEAHERIATCTDLASLERWRQRAKQVASVAELFE